MKKQSKKFVLAGVVLLAIAGLLALTSCKNDSVPEQGTSVQEETWLQGQQKALEGKTEGTYTITAPSYLTEGGLVKIRKLLDGANVPVDLDLSQATGLTYIAAGTFIGCFNLQSVKLPSSVTEIGPYAFAYTNLTEVTIPEGVTTIGISAFNGCSSLAEVTIPASVKTIGYSAFGGCSSLTSVTILKGVTTIGDYAFYNCYSLTEVTILASVTEIGQYAFGGCSSLTDVTIPEGVTFIGVSAFAYTGLTEVTIPDSVKTIEYYAFDGCSNLTSVTFQETGGWCTKTNFYDEAESPESIDVSKPEDNAMNLKDYAGEWYDKYLIRVEP